MLKFSINETRQNQRERLTSVKRFTRERELKLGSAAPQGGGGLFK